MRICKTIQSRHDDLLYTCVYWLPFFHYVYAIKRTRYPNNYPAMLTNLSVSVHVTLRVRTAPWHVIIFKFALFSVSRSMQIYSMSRRWNVHPVQCDVRVYVCPGEGRLSLSMYVFCTGPFESKHSCTMAL